ncbi:MAG: GNAT family N-acetyltransferase [Deltaproteobacteria bacterium]|nr:GNAT family N-acetyltransferase [Deltaproteobacteria bacterium]
MRTTVVSGREVADRRIAAAWRDARAGRTELASPYFDPAYVACMAEVRDDVFVLVVEDGGAVVALLPFQRMPGAVGCPVGGPINDFQGLLALPGVDVEPRWLVRQAGLLWLGFDHWVAEQPAFTAHRTVMAASPVIDLAEGMAGYLARQQAEGRNTASRLRHKARRLERGVGPLRFEWHVEDPEVLARVIEWKTAQSERTGTALLFERPWARAVVDRIRHTQTTPFAGVLSALWAGDRLVAAHMGMRSEHVLHYWFPTHDPELSEYSCGLIFLWHLMEAAAAQGMLRLDLGKGDQAYKDRMKTHDAFVAEGRLAAHPAVGAALRGATRSLAWARDGTLHDPTHQVDRVLRRVRRFLRYR